MHAPRANRNLLVGRGARRMRSAESPRASIGSRTVVDGILGAAHDVSRAARNFLDQEGLQWSGAVAFYLILSVPPLLVVAFSIGVVVVGDETAREFLQTQLAAVVPARQGIVEQLVGRTVTSTGAALPISLAFLLFAGTRVFASLIAAIYVMWREVPEAGLVRSQVVRVLLLGTTGVLFAIAVAADLAVAVVGEAMPPALVALVRAHVLPAALVVGGLIAMFKLVPRRRATWRAAVVGALAGTALLRTVQAAFTAYVATVANFESAYGPIAGAAILMTWALVASAVILFSAHLVAVLSGPGRTADLTPRLRPPGNRPS